MSLRSGPGPTRAASEYMGRVKAMRCICCELLEKQQEWPTEVHHIKQHGIKRHDWLVLPLCGEDCHRGRNGVEKERVYLRILQMDEFDLLALLLSRVIAAKAAGRW